MKDFRAQLLALTILFLPWHTEGTSSPRDFQSGSRLLLLDVDNTVYREKYAGIEAQIVSGIHSYCKESLGIEKDFADELHVKFGSTIEGLQQTIWKDLSIDELEEKLGDFYRNVWANVNPSSVLMPDMDAGSTSTGYSHASKEERKLTRQLLKFSPLPIAFASNSPSWHLHRVLQALGLSKMSGESTFFSPDRLPSYPTKHEAKVFFSETGNKSDDNTVLPKDKPISFLDDSRYNLKRVREAFPLQIDRVHNINRAQEEDSSREGIQDEHGEGNLVQALLQDFGLLDPKFRLSQTRYLESKNKVDRESIDTEIWNGIVDELRERLLDDSYKTEQGTRNVDRQLRIVDLGAGLLSMLDLLLHGDDDHRFKPLIAPSDSNQNKFGNQVLQYIAYESNQELYDSCHDRLLSWGFTVVEKIASADNGLMDIVDYKKEYDGIFYQVKLVLRNFADGNDDVIEKSDPPPNLIIGCCFADLMDPEQLVPDLLRSFGILDPSSSLPNGTLIYFPITFTGTTQFVPPRPFEFQADGKTIPSDTVAFQSYSRALDTVLCHNMNHHLLLDVMEDYGAKLIRFGDSDWKIDPARDEYLYETMLYFFGSTGGPQLLKEGWDAPGWIQRARANRPSIQASNRDLLFRVSPEGNQSRGNQSSTFQSQREDQLAEILFTAPYEVTSTQKVIPQELGPRQVLIRTSYSLISSGTELKIFKGNFDDDAALDVNIKDMEDERMAYPLSYGYCLVGVVVDCGSDVSRQEFIGKSVFTFSSHASHVVTDADAVQIVPSDIDPKDAIFMPSVETALSLVHDARMRAGENVAIYGQGLIGLLVTALLSQGRSADSSGRFNTITTFDMIPDRLAMSSKMGASQALTPGKSFKGGRFDVSIEVSGNFRALQSAIDDTLDGGRIIVGSWYGNKDVSLQLGIDFHRSHKTIQTSQVSELPAALTRLWSKERRFAYTWDLVKQIRPSRLLTKIHSLEEAQEAYDALDKGTEIAIAFEYTKY